MAASAWTVFNNFRRIMADGTLDLDGAGGADGTFDMHLFTSAASANVMNDVLTTLGSMSNEVANGFGYLISGRLMSVIWASGDSIGQMRWDMSTGMIWTAAGSPIANIRYAVIVARTQDSGKNTSNLVLMRAPLTTIEFDLQVGSTLTISTPSGDGIFELSGG